jgi:hypothetical protein
MPVIQSQSAMSGKAETFTYVDFDRSGIGVLQLLAMLAPRRHQVRVGRSRVFRVAFRNPHMRVRVTAFLFHFVFPPLLLFHSFCDVTLLYISEYQTLAHDLR